MSPSSVDVDHRIESRHTRSELDRSVISFEFRPHREWHRWCWARETKMNSILGAKQTVTHLLDMVQSHSWHWQCSFNSLVKSCLRQGSERKRRRTFCMIFVCKEFCLEQVSDSMFNCVEMKWEMTDILPMPERYRIDGPLPEGRTPYAQDDDMWASSDRARSLHNVKLMATIRRQATHVISLRWFSALPIRIKTNHSWATKERTRSKSAVLLCSYEHHTEERMRCWPGASSVSQIKQKGGFAYFRIVCKTFAYSAKSFDWSFRVVAADEEEANSVW